ncbi:MAG TPA: C25 family cysteine peptidase [Chitinophagaceae bacterium]|nr:C25 family cysteine peptidase [Chitinophagaceae bacterium]
MKKNILFTLFIFLTIVSLSQSYNNEWIDYSKTYYKFTIGATAVYRINQSTLSSLGLGNVNAEDFQLWRNGEVVPVHTSVQSGPLPSNGFIEFFGERNDGKPDKALYRKPEYQLMDRYSLQTDTAAFFLTVTPGGNNKHYIDIANNVAANTRLPESYFMYTAGAYFFNKINAGYAAVVGSSYVYSSGYDNGEGPSGSDIGTSGVWSYTFNNLYVEPTGPNFTFNMAATGNAGNMRSLQMKINSTDVGTQVMNYFESAKVNQTGIPISLISTNTAAVQVQNNSSGANDRMAVFYYEINYPRKYIFDGLGSFLFNLPARPDTSYIEISNFGHGNVPPALFDITNQQIIIGDISNPSLVKIVLPPSSVDRRLLLTARTASSYQVVTEIKTRNFIDITNTSNQGDYLIISNPLLYNDGNGNNYVEQYRSYRNSPSGGNYNAKVFDIDELSDQFAFGIKKHPLSIKNFLRYARNNFQQKPKGCLLIGKGITYLDQRLREYLSATNRVNLVPTFGWPASDNLLASDVPGNPTPLTPIGRLSVVHPSEIKAYLDKVKQYEVLIQSNSCSITDKAWMKNVMHVIGAEDAIGNQIDYYMSTPYTDIIQTDNYGGKVNRFRKTSDIAIQQTYNEEVPKLFKEGLSMVTYFGHSSPTVLQFSLDEPKNLKNDGKYPFILANGCQAGNLFLYDTLRSADNLILSEKFLFTEKAGAIAFLASTHLGIVNFLHFYTHEYYNEISKKSYGKTIGEIHANTIDYIIKTYTAEDFFNRQNSEQLALHGDPLLPFYHFNKPDYAIEQPLVNVSPQFISVAETNFNLSFKIMNIGLAVKDSIRIIVKRKYPFDGSEVEILNQKIAAVQYADSIQLTLPILPLRDKGFNRLTFIIDADNVTDEMCESNNFVTKDVFIYENELRPLYPANFAIINKQNITFVASTANPLSGSQQYLMEIDTTELFDSPFKISASAANTGGVVSFAPTISFTEGRVYYWRTGVAQQGGNFANWNYSSFVYLQNSGEGFNQSHYYQYKKNQYYNLILDSIDRAFKYKISLRKLKTATGMYPYFTSAYLRTYLDLEEINFYGCKYQTFQIQVLDGKTLRPWENVNVAGTGLYGSAPICQRPYRNFFEYSYLDSSSRRKAMDFLKMVPDSNYIIISNLGGTFTPIVSATTLMSDTSYLGSGVSLYHLIKSFGLDLIDSFVSNRPLLFVFKKNDFTFPAQQFTAQTTELISKEFEIPGLINVGVIESPWFGPVKKWEELHWGTENIEPQPDDVSVEIIGRDGDGAIIPLATINPSKDTSISFIDAAIYPFIKLRMNNVDTINSSPSQLQFWRLNASPLPEGLVAPNLGFEFKEIVNQGELLNIKVAFKNISGVAFSDSLLLKCIITDRNNVPHDIFIPKIRPLNAGEFTTIDFAFDTKNYAGKNTMYFMVNPDGVVPEQYLFNNFFYKDFVVDEDTYNPLLDVTFDGLHILNRDIVSSKPHIQIKLKDESKYISLGDTSLFQIQIRYPNGTIKDFTFSNPEVSFTPANLSNGENVAKVDIQPSFLQDGEYELIVSAKDINGNKAGTVPYRILFEVINKPMISNFLNYPNPFTTSTAFVFTVTGSEVPQNIKIQILTITGKIVREITKEELGPIHIGRNITEFKWDGTDQFGQKLANGVYLYRVVTNLNGKTLDKYKATDDNTDKFFNNGYGKMYLLR